MYKMCPHWAPAVAWIYGGELTLFTLYNSDTPNYRIFYSNFRLNRALRTLTEYGFT